MSFGYEPNRPYSSQLTLHPWVSWPGFCWNLPTESVGRPCLFNVNILNRWGCCKRPSFCPNWESNRGPRALGPEQHPLGRRFTADISHYSQLQTHPTYSKNNNLKVVATASCMPQSKEKIELPGDTSMLPPMCRDNGKPITMEQIAPTLRKLSRDSPTDG